MMRVKTGLQVLADDGFRRLAGKKVGLVTHPAGILADGTSAIEALRKGGVALKALFGPEHGVRGDVAAGKWVASYTDRATGLPVYSLYGPTKVPTAAMLQGLDLLLFDLQDIGCRSYTYLSTLGAVLEGAARVKLPVLVLDRPNPIGLERVEGGPVRAGFSSFVSKYPVAYRHGMTLGEVAQLLCKEGWLAGAAQPALSVVWCSGLTRATPWAELELPWRPTSPNVPRATTCLYYAATGITGELGRVAVGIGTERQFEYAGAAGIEAKRLTDALQPLLPDEGGITVTPATWTPTKGVFAGQTCGGVRFAIPDADAPLTQPNIALLVALKKLGYGNLFSSREETRMFDLSCGTDTVRRAFLKGAPMEEIWGAFNNGVGVFLAKRKKYLHYS